MEYGFIRFKGDKETQFTMHKFRQMGMMSLYLYKYLFGFLFKDMAEHAGYSVEDIKEEMKEYGRE